MKTSHSKLWVESDRWILHFFATKNPITALWFVLPILCLWISQINLGNTSLLLTSALVIFGILTWTLLEYLIHRYIFHWRPKNKIIKNAFESIHLYHHRNQEDQGVITSGPLSALFWSALNFSLYYVILKDTSLVSLIMVGLTVSYYSYEWVHYLVHHKIYTSGIMKYLQDYHLIHHEKWAGNYGQTSPIWDIIFSTRLDRHKLRAERKKKYIFNSCTNASTLLKTTV